jgi:hypothetical protein
MSTGLPSSGLNAFFASQDGDTIVVGKTGTHGAAFEMTMRSVEYDRLAQV